MTSRAYWGRCRWRASRTGWKSCSTHSRSAMNTRGSRSRECWPPRTRLKSISKACALITTSWTRSSWTVVWNSVTSRKKTNLTSISVRNSKKCLKCPSQMKTPSRKSACEASNCRQGVICLSTRLSCQRGLRASEIYTPLVLNYPNRIIWWKTLTCRPRLSRRTREMWAFRLVSGGPPHHHLTGFRKGSRLITIVLSTD